MQFISAFICFIALMESFYAKPRGKRREKYATGKRTSKNSVISKKNKIILPWLLGSFHASIVGSIVFEVLLSVKYNLFFHFNVSVCC